MSLFDCIGDGLGHLTDDEFYELLKPGIVYRPYVPLQVSNIFPIRDFRIGESGHEITITPVTPAGDSHGPSQATKTKK